MKNGKATCHDPARPARRSPDIRAPSSGHSCSAAVPRAACRKSAVVTAIMTAWLTAGCGVPPAAGPADTFGLDFSLPVEASVRGAILFLVDGLNAQVFEEMLDAGELPAIEKYFAARGLYAPRAVATVPSVTMANLTSIVTGLFGGHHGITGVNWFDRNRLVWRDYETIAQKNALDGDYNAPNIYEFLAGRTTFSVFCQPHRGATKFIENWTSAGPAFFFGWYEFVDRLALYRLNIVADVARKRQAFPALTIVYLLAPDFRAYTHGVSSAEYRRAIRHTDRQIGKVMGDLERAGLLERIVVALVSDHGMRDVNRNFPIARFLRRDVGLEIASRRLWEQTPFERRLDYYRRYPVVLFGSGDRYWSVSLRRPVRRDGAVSFDAWPVRPGPEDLGAYPTRHGPRDLIAELIAPEAVDAFAYAPGSNRVRLRRKGGEVEFRRQGRSDGKISYHLISGDDPLEWSGKLPPEALAGESMSGPEWLSATAQSDFPDAPAQLLAYFRAPRAGDIVLFAAPGWDFGTTNRAGHGGLSPQEMYVPLLLAGPGVPKGRLGPVRTVDLMPTLLELLGGAVPDDLDGRSVLGLAAQAKAPPR